MESAQSEIDELSSKIEENNKLIDKANEIGGNDSYINRLQTENAELERQIELEKILKEQEEKELADEAFKALIAKSKYHHIPYSSSEDFTLLSETEARMNWYEYGDFSSSAKREEVLSEITENIRQISQYYELLDRTNPEHNLAYDQAARLIDRYKAIFEIQGESAKEAEISLDTQKTELRQLNGEYGDLVDKLKEYKDELKDSNTLLDKQNAVLEAQKDYEEAIAKAREKYAEEVAKARKELMLNALDNFSKGLEYEEKLEEKLQKVEEKRLKLNEEIAKAKTDYLKNALEQYVDKLEEEASLEEKILAVEEARRKLEEARGQRNVKVYNSNTKTWEWQANEKNIASAEEDLADKQQALNEYLENEAFKEINSYLEDGGYSISEVQKILDKWLSKGNGGELNTWGKGLMSIVTDSIRNNKYDDTDVQDKVDGVTDAVDALNEYLKDTAVKEIKELLNGGNFSMSDIQAIIDKWGARTESGSLGAWEQNLMSALGTAASQAVSVEFDTSGIDSALEKLNSAQTGLQDYLAEQLLSEYIEMFENGTATNASANSILNKYKKLGVSEDILEKIFNLILSTTGINIRGSGARFYGGGGGYADYGFNQGLGKVSKYDSGGILQGMGIKATNRDEAVINPALTSRLMSPVFNRKFFNFSQGLSNLADYVDRIPDGNGVVYRNQSSSVDDHRSYSVNGVPISADVAERNTLADIFRMAAFKKN